MLTSSVLAPTVNPAVSRVTSLVTSTAEQIHSLTEIEIGETVIFAGHYSCGVATEVQRREFDKG